MQELKNYLGYLEEFLEHCRIYFVGGLVRDILLKRKKNIFDCDLVVEKDAIKISKKFAQKIKAAWFVIDEINQVYRVIKKDYKKWQFDFSLIKGGDIISDLKSRDYTINALALELKPKTALDFKNLIDPCNGQRDLDQRIIRSIEEKNLISDPIRILRGVSLASELEFKIEEATFKLLKKYTSLLSSETGERISEELFKILKNDFSYRFFELMQELKILDSIIPGWSELRKPYPGPYHHLPIDLHSLESLKQLELLLAENKQWQDLYNYLQDEIRENRRRVEILKLATLLHDIGKGPAYFMDEHGKVKFTGHEKIGVNLIKEFSFKLKLSRKEMQMLLDMIYYHLRPGFLVDCLEESKRAVFRYFRDTGEEAISIILLSIADKEATRGELIAEEDITRHKQILLNLIRNYFQEKEEIKPPKLINGYDVMNILEIPSSPKVGEILRAIEEKQALGEISSRKEALSYLEEIKHNLR